MPRIRELEVNIEGQLFFATDSGVSATDPAASTSAPVGDGRESASASQGRDDRKRHGGIGRADTGVFDSRLQDGNSGAQHDSRGRGGGGLERGTAAGRGFSG